MAPGPGALLAVALAAFAGTLAALIAHEHWRVQPRSEQMQRDFAHIESRMREAAEVSHRELERAQAEATRLQDRFDAHLNQQLSHTLDLIEELDIESERRAIITDVLRRTRPRRLNVMEYFVSNGAWPTYAHQAGFPNLDVLPSGAWVTMQSGGTISIDLGPSWPSPARIHLVPVDDPASDQVEWHCRGEGEGVQELLRLSRGCRR
ncbi:MAG TPA: hypothetical protein PKZ76_12430 [Xanthomonadaceae bacterium]|nr:hypothetical protein [Xanthomonadaceae bacterium]